MPACSSSSPPNNKNSPTPSTSPSRPATGSCSKTSRASSPSTITPAGPLGSRYAVALAGRFLGYATDLEQAKAMLRAAMDTDRYWPDAWFISDHGNPDRLDLTQP